MRWNSPVRRTRRSTAVIRCVPLFVPTTAWISSRMTVAIPVSMARPLRELRMMFRLSGVVMRISGGCRSICRRSSAGVSPLRVRTPMAGKASPASLKACGKLLQAGW